MNPYLRLIVSLAAVMFLATTFGFVSDQTEPAPRKPPKLDPNSSPLRIIYDVFVENGYSQQDAADLAEHCKNRTKVEKEPDRVKKNGPRLDPNSSPLRIVYDAFVESGYSGQEAVDLAAKCLGVENDDGGAKDGCMAYSARAVYCDAMGEQRTWEGWIARNCWDLTIGPCATLNCPTGECNWLRVTMNSGCTRVPPTGACIWLRAWGDPISISCDAGIINCACIVETQCSQIEQECLHCKTAGSGCPSCN